jgi:hypothetical protein
MHTSLERIATLRSLRAAPSSHSGSWDDDADHADREYRGQNRYAWYDPRKIWDKKPFVWTPDPEFRFQTTWQQLLATWSVSDEIIESIQSKHEVSPNDETRTAYRFERNPFRFSLVHRRCVAREDDVNKAYDFQYKVRLHAASGRKDEASLIHCKIDCISSENERENHYECFLLFCTGFKWLGTQFDLKLPDDIMLDCTENVDEGKDAKYHMAVHKSVHIDEELKWYGSERELLACSISRTGETRNTIVCTVPNLAVTQTLWRAYTSLSHTMDKCGYQRGVGCKIFENGNLCIMSFYKEEVYKNLPDNDIFKTLDRTAADPIITAAAEVRAPIVGNQPANYEHKHQPSDGNCLFHSIAAGYNDIVGKNVHNHESLRTAVVEDMRANWDEFFAGSDKDTYLVTMSKNKTWGGGLEIRAAAAVLQSHIHVYSDSLGSVQHFAPRGCEDACRDNIIYILYKGGNHYDVFLKRPTN